MRKATKNDLFKVVDVISATCRRNQGINWMMRKGGDFQKQVKRLAEYAFIKSYLRDGAYISSNEKGVALCYKFNYKVRSFTEFLYKIKFILTSIDFSRMVKVHYLELYKKSQRPASGEYLYFWFFAVLKGGQNAGFEIKNEIFKLAVVKKLPIYAETSLKRNKNIYERFGFETYHYYEDKKENLKYWFMKWDPCNAKNKLTHK